MKNEPSPEQKRRNRWIVLAVWTVAILVFIIVVAWKIRYGPPVTP